jgi:hypothetical protein
MGDTQRTDAESKLAWKDAINRVEQVPSDFARTLERELNEAKVFAETQRQLIDTAIETNKAIAKDRDKLTQKLGEALDCWESQVRVINDDRAKWKQCAESCARVLFIHDQSQISISIPEWQEMQKKALAHFNQLKGQDKCQ